MTEKASPDHSSDGRTDAAVATTVTGMSSGLLTRLRLVLADTRVDAALAAVAAVAIELEFATVFHDLPSAKRAVLAVIGLAMGVSLAWRRRRPLITWAVVIGSLMTATVTVRAGSGHHVGQGPLVPFLVVLVAAYSFAAYGAWRLLPAGAAVLTVGVAVSVTVQAVTDAAVDVGMWVVVAVSIGIGLLMRHRVVRVVQLEQQTEDLQRQQAENTRLAVAAERSRIARELHDVIAHSVSVMVVQAGSARHTLNGEDRELAEVLRSIESSGRNALVELRRLLGILRTSDDAASLAPAPGVGELPRLVEQIATAGLPTDLRVVGDVVPLPPGVDMAVYRIAQEALTNALKHAGPATAEVTVEFRPYEVTVHVSDDGPGAATDTTGAGRGLIGMRERVTLYGGTLRTQRTAPGFTVTATIPLERALR